MSDRQLRAVSVAQATPTSPAKAEPACEGQRARVEHPAVGLPGNRGCHGLGRRAPPGEVEIGGHRWRSAALAPAPRRPRQRVLTEDPARIERGSRVRAWLGSSAIASTFVTFGASCCRSSTTSPPGRRRRRGESGWIASRRWRRDPSLPRTGASRVLRQLRPMSAIGPVSLDEARDVISGSAAVARARAAEVALRPGVRRQPASGTRPRVPVVFVPGLAERMFPQKPHEDPMLLDREMRTPLGADLANCRKTAAVPSVCCCGWRWAPQPSGYGCRIRAWTWPSHGRACRRSTRSTSCARSPGASPNHEQLQEAAAEEGGAPGWRGQRRTTRRMAIDDLEHDLSVLRSAVAGGPRRRCADRRTTCFG